MESNFNANFFLWLIAGLVVLGLVMLSTASAAFSYYSKGDNYYFLKQQIFNGVAPGVILFFLASRIPYRKLKKPASFLLLGAIILLFLLFIPELGITIDGSTRWLNAGFFSFQPSELLKLAFIIYLAAFFESKKDKVSDFKESTFPFIGVCALIGVLLLLQPDLGTLCVTLLIALAVYFASGVQKSKIVMIILLGAIGMAFLIFGLGYGERRIAVYLNPDTDPLGMGYQINQAKSVIASGGYFGLGFGASQIKTARRLPEPMGDSIFAVIAQELGFFGVLSVLALFSAFGWYGFKIAKTARDKFGSLLVVGIVSWILIQGFVNIGAISGFLPLTGIPLPFVSFGGTSLAVLLTATGIIYNIQRTSL